MQYISQSIFFLMLSTAAFFIFRSIVRIRKNILSGKEENRSDQPARRVKNMLLVAFGQKKMFKKPIPAFLHLFIYLGFIIVNIEILEIVLDGLFGTHRILASPLYQFYPFLINVFEFFAVAVIFSCIIFLIRRNVLKISRFKGEEMRKWPKLDANLILSIEILLMIAFLSMNAADTVLQNREPAASIPAGGFFFSSFMIQLFSGLSSQNLMVIERSCWWFHIAGVFFFANYILLDSKHLHIFMAFPNTYFSRLSPAGKWDNMRTVTKEVKLMLNLPSEETSGQEEPPGRFGAKDVEDLTWKNLMDAYSCTECGRCTQQCPANITGKKLSPRKIMMDTRDRLEEKGKNISLHGKDFEDGKALLEDYITSEELLACTTCNACVEACPVNIDPLNIIVQLRRYKIMEASQAPGSWNAMFSNIENNFAPWKFSPSDRFNWSEKLKEAEDSESNPKI
jgi:heterodisulfide reductase subunit C